MLTVIYSLIDVLIVVLLVYLFRKFASRVHRVEATVVRKVNESSETVKTTSGIFGSKEKTISSGYTLCLVTFELGNGKELEFHIGDESEEINVMDHGILTYKKRNFLGFEKDAEI